VSEQYESDTLCPSERLHVTERVCVPPPQDAEHDDHEPVVYEYVTGGGGLGETGGGGLGESGGGGLVQAMHAHAPSTVTGSIAKRSVFHGPALYSACHSLTFKKFNSAFIFMLYCTPRTPTLMFVRRLCISPPQFSSPHGTKYDDFDGSDGILGSPGTLEVVLPPFGQILFL